MLSHIPVKVSPGAKRSRLMGWMADGTLKLAVTAPPEGGRANAAVCELLAEHLGLSPSQVRIHSGATNPRKVIAVESLTADQIRQRLNGNNLWDAPARDR